MDNKDQRDIQMTCWLDDHVGHFIVQGHQIRHIAFVPRVWEMDKGLWCMNCSEYFKNDDVFV